MRKSFCICNNCRTEYEAGAPGTINVPHAVAARAARGESILLCAKCVAAMRVNSTSARRWQLEAAFGLGATVGVQTSGGWYMYQANPEELLREGDGQRVERCGNVCYWRQAYSPAFEGCNAYSREAYCTNTSLPSGIQYGVWMPSECGDDDDTLQARAWLRARRELGKPVEF